MATLETKMQKDNYRLGSILIKNVRSHKGYMFTVVDTHLFLIIIMVQNFSQQTVTLPVFAFSAL